METQDELKNILIFDSNGDFYCEAPSGTLAAKITNGNVSNIFRVANNGDIISTGGFYFVAKKSTRQEIKYLELAIKIIIANETKGLNNRITEILKLIKNEHNRSNTES